ncbi:MULTISPECIES: CPBP family intramembrane glutamic endopeptidase [Nitrosopumilus]|uniref:Abortive infection protein n=1 Tax=Nitrosopumilus piranensis TaxID=1582439 RepID=A0A0C5BX24_9ARCH|nr:MULTISPECIES: CPBP family intramembrane glutamic endopeptidase [Nitrosopumilus]AJM92856.1 Abortive infection protein [Nitrosopumilus piranensis]KAF6244663.1 CPBP family intramembrane metalloprotease domain-containing protein [Nitrosopumilus sp. b2]
MQNKTKLLQAIGIPFTALLSVIFGLLLVSFPIGAFVIFESDVGNDINYDFPVTHLALFEGTSIHQTFSNISIGDVFVVLWIFYAVLFVIALLGPQTGFLKSFTSIISFGKYDATSNYMIGVTKWLSILVLVSVVINFVQEQFGIVTVPPLDDNDLIQFFYVSLAPLIEEVGFRLILLGIPLFALYSHRTSPKYFLKCLWSPRNLDVYDSRKAIFLIVFVGVLFGFAHIAFGDSWSEGKFAQATAGGIILGWVYLRFGFVASLLIHWATNYFIFSYATFISQINSISIENAFSHSLMSTLELLLLASGIFSVAMLFLSRFYFKKESALEI